MIDVLSAIFAPFSLFVMIMGVTLGIIIGATPGLSTIMAIVILLPVTYTMDSISGMYLLLGAYCGGTYGGSISAILINTPGTISAGATVLDGYPMAQKGQGGNALKIALVGSTFGGIFSCFALIFFAPIIADVAFQFGPAEFFSLTIFGITMVAAVSGKNPGKGFISALFGLGIAMVGIDPIEGVPRLMFGVNNLLAGINLVVVMLGMFALSETLRRCTEKEKTTKALEVTKASITIRDIFKHWKTMLVTSLVGLYVGAVPGTGGGIGAFMSYNVAKNMSKTPEEFGTGCLEGVLGPETGNNATTGAAMIPMLTLGLPGSAAVAVLMGALAMQNITPGPELFTKDTFWVYSIMVGLIVINVIMFVQGSLLSRAFARVSTISYKLLIPAILMLCVLGSYSIRSSEFDVLLLIGFAAVGYLMKWCGFPVPPLAIGFVLGSLSEKNFRRAMTLSDGSWSIFVTRPISLAFLLITVFALVQPYIKKAMAAKKAQKNAMAEGGN